ncbi:MAG: hypothetical protein GY866_08080 [Proteobacteria bacterium]|nr:hypothetical protein [Pseudomonadota bacterium]
MSRRSQWKQVEKAMNNGNQMGRTVAEKEAMPEKACGSCSRFSENAKEGDGRGTCGILKMGSDLKSTPPKMVTAGDVGLVIYMNTDGAKCSHYSKMKMIDKDGGETSDPLYRRALRQMENV